MLPLAPGFLAAATAALFGLALLAVARRPRGVLAAPAAVLAGVLLLTLAAAAVLFRVDPLEPRLRIDASTEPLLPRGDPARLDHARATRTFGDDEVFVVAMRTERGVFTRENLHALRRVRDRIARLDGVRDVRSLSDVYAFRYVAEDDWVDVRPFLEEIPEEPAALAALRERALADPVYRRTLISDDGRTAALNVSFRDLSDEAFIAADLDGQIGAVLAEESGNGRRFHVAGRPHVKTHVFHRVVRDLRLLIPAGLAVMAVVSGLAFGRWQGIAAPLGIAAVANLWTFAAMVLAGRSGTILTALLGPTLIALGCVYGIHVFARVEEEVERDPEDAVGRALEHLVAPVLIAGTTTVVGFAALLVSDVPAVVDLGSFAAFGMASITLLALTAAPAGLTLAPPPPRGDGEGLGAALARRLDARLEAVGRFAARRATAVLVAAGAAALVAAAALPRIVVDTDYLSFFAAGDPLRRDFEAVNVALAGAVPLYVSLYGESGSFRDPGRLALLEELQSRLEAIPGVSRSVSFLESLRVLNRAIEADDPAEERIPDSRGAVTELLFLVPKGELARLVTVDHGAANLVLRTGRIGSSAVVALAEAVEAELARLAPDAGTEVILSGNALLLARSADGIARSQPLSVGLAALAILGLVTVSLGSLRLGLLTMPPNLLPVLLFFGVLGLGAASLSLPTSLIGCVALGIAVDDTAHFLVRYRRERRAGADPREAVTRCCRRVGRPIVITSVTLCLGFGVVLLSGLVTLREFGALSALTMGLCLVADLLLLPALLVRARA